MAGTAAGSGGGQTTNAGAGGADAPSAAAGSNGSSVPALPAGVTGQSARIEETGQLTLLVPGSAISTDIARLGALAAADGGFVAASQTQSGSSGAPAQGTVTLQVPQPSFSAVVDQARSYGKVGSLSTKATDVTGQYVDLQARITALQDSRQQYLTILSRATSIGDILSVQSQLDDLQSQLEQLQGQLQVLDGQTTYATLDVTLTQNLAPAPAPAAPSGLSTAWHGAVHGFVAGIDGLVRLAGPLLFALLVLAALGLGGRLAWRLGRRRLT